MELTQNNLQAPLIQYLIHSESKYLTLIIYEQGSFLLLLTGVCADLR